jgi:hypothetical protein
MPLLTTGGGTYAPIAPATGSFILREDGSYLLREDGFKFIREDIGFLTDGGGVILTGGGNQLLAD